MRKPGRFCNCYRHQLLQGSQTKFNLASSPWAQTGFVSQPPLEIKQSKVFTTDSIDLDSHFITKTGRHASTHNSDDDGIPGDIFGDNIQLEDLEELPPVLGDAQEKDENLPLWLLNLPLWLLDALMEQAGEIESASEKGNLDEYLRKIATEYEVMLPTLHKVIRLLPLK